MRINFYNNWRQGKEFDIISFNLKITEGFLMIGFGLSGVGLAIVIKLYD